MSPNRAGFTLIEIVISLAILAVSLAVLVESEASAVVLTVDSQRTLTATTLAEQTLAELLLQLEINGISDSDQSGEGRYSDFGADGKFGQQADFTGEYDEFQYAWTIRKVDMQIGDAAAAIADLQDMGGTSQTQSATGSSKDLSMLSAFMSPEMLSEMLGPWMREVRVMVWWGYDPGYLHADSICDNCVELVTHIFNQSGVIIASNGEETQAGTSSGSPGGSVSSGSGGSGSGGSGVGGSRGGGGSLGGGGR